MTKILHKISDNLCVLETRTAEFFNIVTRNPMCVADIIALDHFHKRMWGKFIDIQHYINVSPATPKKVLEVLDTYKDRKDILKDTTHAVHLSNTWMDSIKGCELGRDSEVVQKQWMELLIGAVSDSLDEIRDFKDWLDKTIDELKDKGEK